MKFTVIFSLFLFFFSSFASAEADIEGSQDTEILGRIPGSHISAYYTSDYGEILLPLSANSRSEKDVFDRLEVGGEQELVIYEVPEAVSSSVARIYQSILDEVNKKQINILFSCKSWKDQCGYFLPRKVLIENRGEASSKIYQDGLGNSKNYSKGAAEFGMIVGELVHQEKKTYLLIVVGKSKWDKLVGYSYEVITAGEMESIALTEAVLRAEIETQGKAVLSGLYFDNAKATLKEESEAALATIANYIQANPQYYVVVGHTDANGDFLANQWLSKARAEAVVERLVKHYKVDKSLLNPVGVSYASPVATNKTEAGRAKNRRVELVPDIK